MHPNTVRYRMRQVADLTGFTPATPRDALTLQIALVLGRSPGRVPARVFVGTRQSSRAHFVRAGCALHAATRAECASVLVIVAPGQGAQTPGFLAPWLEDDVFASRLHWL